MRNNAPFYLATLLISMFMSTDVLAAYTLNNVELSATAGLGYDSNVFRAPRSSYTNYALATPVLVTPQKKTGFFVPYKVQAKSAVDMQDNALLLSSASVDGKYYLNSALSNANEFNLKLDGGGEFTLRGKETSKDTLYAGLVIEKHDKVYYDRATGAGRTASNRYNYVSTGAEAKYKNRSGAVDFSVSGKYLIKDFDTPVIGSEWDHVYTEIGADVDIPVAPISKLNISFAHSTEDYSKRHARDSQGVYSTANPMLLYTYNNLDFTLHNRISTDLRVYADCDFEQRTDGFVNYNDYKQYRLGARVLYKFGRIKTRLAFHHWARNYPNAFAFDNPIGGAKTYNGNVFKFKTEMAQTDNSSLWAELAYNSQNTTDLRYDYSRTQIMAGMTWEY